MAQNTTQPSGNLKTGDRLTLRLESMGAEGRAVGRHEGMAVLVARGLPGERVVAEVTEAHPRYALARVAEVLEPSPARRAAPCAQFAVCGGCDWQHLDEAAQAIHKRAVAEDQLARIGGMEPPPGWGVQASPLALGYRDRLDFTLAEEGEGWAPAFHGWADTAPVPINACLLAPESLTSLARAAARWVAAHVPPVATDTQGKPQPPLERIAVQTAGAEGSRLALTLHTDHPGATAYLLRQGETLAAALGADFPALVTVTVAERKSPAREGPTALHTLHGPSDVEKAVGGSTYSLPPTAFFQVNPLQTAQMVAHVLSLAGAPVPTAEGRPPTAFDLFCGVGLFSLPLAAAGYRMVGAEHQQEAVRAAQRNARHHGLHECRFLRLDLGRADALEQLRSRFGDPGLVLVNPPRRGLGAGLTRALAAAPVPRLIYVSCDGATFARDAARLRAAYDLAALQGFDQFPQTHHLELVGLFTPRPE